jgi:acetyl-CoA carboxylase biotin carboxyl carrier protein
MSATEIDLDEIRALAQLLDDAELTEIEVKVGEKRIRLSRQTVAVAQPAAAPMATIPAPAQAASAPGAPATVEAAQHAGAVTSPMVGTVYVAPEPGAAPFVQIGDTVAEGQTVLIVEAMKTMNPIPAPRAGRIAAILVADAQPVEFGEPLLVIE